MFRVAIAAVVTALALAATYTAVCAVSPTTTCSSCSGAGIVKRILGGVRRCPSCGGVGWKTRTGRRLLTALVTRRNTRRAESSDPEAAA
jgi:DnaJ-class molecular chaperone